jgi:YesN/AraC family two-component response regulator
MTRLTLAKTLSRHVQTVLVAENGRAGLELFRAQAPDVVVTDITMPIMGGLEMAREIKRLDAEAQVVVTTAHSDTAYMLEAIELGVDAYVLKPVDLTKLLAAIRRCWAVADHRTQARRHEAEREAFVRELQEAMAKVKTLSGLLPICASCKRIREDDGYWKQIEAYISERSATQFSHGICPECAARLYPELADEP